MMDLRIPLLGLLVGLSILAARPAAAADACASEGRVHYLCGPKNVEDMVQVPGSRWIIASGMTGPEDPVGHLYLIDSKARTVSPLAAEIWGKPHAPPGDCPGAPDLSRLAPHGLALRRGSKGHDVLYVVNHGGREAVELFDVDRAEGSPKLAWIGCVLMPDKGSGNAVTPLANGGLVVTKFEEAGDQKAFDKMAAGQVTGALYRWRPGKGFERIAGSDMSGPNGVEASPDGRWLVANAWPEKRLARFDLRGPSKPVSIRTDFLPDNVRLAPDGSMLVTGQASDMKTLLACKEDRCPHAWTVARLDPKTMKLRTILHVEGTRAFSDATVALQVGRTLWIGTYRGDRLAYVALP